MKRRTRATGTIVFGLALLVVPFVAPQGAGAQEEAEFLGFTFLADSDAITMTGGSQGSAGYPQTASQTAHTETAVRTGPNANSLASAQWPGRFLGNLGSLIQVFGGPEESNNLNYPVRAEASSSGPKEASSQGVTATADGGVATADAQVEGFDDGADFFSFGDARTSSRSALDGPLGTSVATATVTDIDFGGVITIDSVVTRASVSTDGETGTATGETVVSGLEIAGQPATVDENGVSFAGEGQPNPADAVRQQVIDAALANFSDGFTVEMYTAEPVTRNEGSIQEYRSGSLVILMTFGDPQGDGGDGAFIIGGSNAFVQASPGINFGSDLPAFTPPPTPSADLPVDTAPAPTPVTDTPVTEAPAEEAAPAPAEPTPAPAVASPSLADIVRFGGVPFAMPFFVLLASLFIGRGLHLFHQSLIESPVGTTCIDDRAT